MKIIGVTFDSENRIFYYTYSDPIKIGYNVIVENENGKYLATVATEMHDIDENKLNSPLGKILRIGTKEDYKKYLENKKQELSVIKKCESLIKKYSLNMKILSAKFTLNRNQLLISFYSEDRVDFRNLAKDLASIYKTRIELRQIGVRDKAKLVGGVGICGQKLCCSRFLKNFDSVSISMAKNQDLALNPSKINGVCGRLMCCLKYEDSCYSSLKKTLPQVGKSVNIDGVCGKVVNVDILKRKYKVELENENIVEEYVDESN